MNRNITFFISSLGGGGAEQVCVSLANGFSQKGWVVTLLVLNLENEKFLKDINDSINVVSLGVANARYSFLSLYSHIYKEGSGVWLVFNYELVSILNIIRKFLRKDIYIVARNINNFSAVSSSGGYLNKLVFKVIRRFYGCADHYINQCNSMEDDLINSFPSISAKTSVIYNPVKRSVLSFDKDNLKLEGDEKEYFLCVGRLEKQKGLERAIFAFSEYIKKHSEERLVIIGQGSLDLELKQLVKSLGIERNVDFPGFKENTNDYYYKAKATLLTSYYEGFPNVLVESICMGTPVISINCPTGPSEIVNSDNGILVENVDELVGALRSFKSSDYDRDVVKSTGNIYDPEYVVQQYNDLIVTLLDRESK